MTKELSTEELINHGSGCGVPMDRILELRSEFGGMIDERPPV